jgi:hypothetical protein
MRLIQPFEGHVPPRGVVLWGADELRQAAFNVSGLRSGSTFSTFELDSPAPHLAAPSHDGAAWSGGPRTTLSGKSTSSDPL